MRMPFADVGAFKIPDGMSDEQALPCADIFATGLMGAELCNIKPGDVVAVWGCGPVGQFVIKSAFLLGAEQVIAIDNVRERLHLAARCEWGDAVKPRPGRSLRCAQDVDGRPRARRLRRRRRHGGTRV